MSYTDQGSTKKSSKRGPKYVLLLLERPTRRTLNTVVALIKRLTPDADGVFLVGGISDEDRRYIGDNLPIVEAEGDFNLLLDMSMYAVIGYDKTGGGGSIGFGVLRAIDNSNITQVMVGIRESKD